MEGRIEETSAAWLPPTGEPIEDRPDLAPEPAADTPEISIADGCSKRLHPNCVRANEIAGWIWLAVQTPLFLIGLVLTYVFEWLPDWTMWPAIALALLITAGMLWLTLVYPRLEYRYTSYTVDALGIEIRQGVFWREVTLVPRSRVQHTDVSQGPLQRKFGLSTLKIHTAGTESATVELSGVGHAQALAVRDYLIVGDETDAL